MDLGWIREGLKRPGKTQIGLAKALGVDPSAISRLLKGERQLRASEIAPASNYLGVGPGAAEAPEEPTRYSADQDLGNAKLINLSDITKYRDLPVVGTAMGGPHGYFEMQGTIIERVWRPPHLMTVSSAFALYVAGSSMSPRYEEGELIYCRPDRRPRPFDWVVLEMHQKQDGAPIMATIGQFKRQTDTYIEINKLNPAETMRVPAKKVRRVHIIVGTGAP